MEKIKNFFRILKYFNRNQMTQLQSGMSSKRARGFKKIILRAILIFGLIAYSIAMAEGFIATEKKMSGSIDGSKILTFTRTFLMLISLFSIFTAFATFTSQKQDQMFRTFPIGKISRYFIEILSVIKPIVMVGLFLEAIAAYIFIRLKIYRVDLLLLNIIPLLLIPFIFYTVIHIVVKFICLLLSKVISKKNIQTITLFILTIVIFIFAFFGGSASSDTGSPVFSFVDKIADIKLFKIIVGFESNVLINALILVAIAAIEFVLGVFVIYRVSEYLNIALMNENPLISRIFNRKVDLNKEVQSIKYRKPFSVFLGYETKFYFRRPMVLFNTVLVVILMPIVIVVQFFVGLNQASERSLERLSNIEIEINDKKENKVVTIKKNIKEDVEKFVKDLPTFVMMSNNEMKKEVFGKFLQRYGDITEKSKKKISSNIENICFKKFIYENISNLVKGEFAKELSSLIPKTLLAYILIGSGAITIFSIYIGAFSISKDRDNLNILKTLPMNQGIMLLAKKVIALVFAAISPIIVFILMLISLRGYFVNTTMLLAFVAAILISNITYDLHSFVDLIHPNFTWQNDSQLVKNSANIFISFIISSIVLVGGIIAAFKLSATFGSEKAPMYLSIAIIVISIILDIIYYKYGKKRLKELTV